MKISFRTTEKDLGNIKILNTTNQTITSDLKYNLTNFNENINNRSSDFINIVVMIKRLFVELFKWDGITLKEALLLETLLFEYGKVAVIKLDNKPYFCNFSQIGEELDFYGYPKEIELLVPGNPLNGKKIKNDKFAIIYNNSNQNATLMYLLGRIQIIVDTLDHVDNAISLSAQKVLLGKTNDDVGKYELEKNIRSKDIVLNVPQEDLKDIENSLLQLEDRSKSKQEQYIFQLNNLLTFLGFKTADLVAKKERMTEMETANNDKFEGLIFKDMFTSRVIGGEEIKEKLQLTITPQTNEIIENEPNKKDMVNGEENKKLIMKDNKKGEEDVQQ